MRPLLTAALSLGLTTMAFAAPAAAQSARIERAQVYRSILPSELGTLLNTFGYASVTKNGDKTFDIVTETGFNFSVELTACDTEASAPQPCFGIIFFSTWTLEANDRAKIGPVVDRFNDGFRIGKAFLMSDRVYAERYVITDGGVTTDHIRDEADTFLAVMDQLGQRLHDALTP